MLLVLEFEFIRSMFYWFSTIWVFVNEIDAKILLVR